MQKPNIEDMERAAEYLRREDTFKSVAAFLARIAEDERITRQAKDLAKLTGENAAKLRKTIRHNKRKNKNGA
jgi:hypothetical protein